MSGIRRFMFLTAAAGLLVAAGSTAQAAGALAIGKCDRNGWSYGYGSVMEAREQAIKHCASEGDTSCHVVYSIEGECAAFAVSGSCGARGWARAADRSGAEEAAVEACQSYGGTDCGVRRWICDGQ
jgi:hypothetical protein